jgi:plastocyanin
VQNNAMGVFFALTAGAALAIGLIAVLVTPAVFAPAKPQLSFVVFPEGSSLEQSGKEIEPKQIQVTIGVNNTVVWVNQDSTTHSVVSEYVDPVSGPFNTFASQRHTGLIPPGQTFEFTFTQPGTYDYYMIPHPHMQGTVVVHPPTL